MGGSDLPDLKAEFSDLPHERGTLSMARSQDPDSANSQFFICFKEASFLDRQYTVFERLLMVWILLIRLKEEMRIIMDLFLIQTRSLVLNNTHLQLWH